MNFYFAEISGFARLRPDTGRTQGVIADFGFDAGIFGAAPSVALASLGLTFLTKGVQHASVDGHAMVLGAVALCAYSVVVARLLLRYRWNPIVATGSAWLVWLAVAFGLWAISLR